MHFRVALGVRGEPGRAGVRRVLRCAGGWAITGALPNDPWSEDTSRFGAMPLAL